MNLAESVCWKFHPTPRRRPSLSLLSCLSPSNAFCSTFCNYDYGSLGFCQNCAPLMTAGDGKEEVCDDRQFVTAGGSEECKRVCFPSSASLLT